MSLLEVLFAMGILLIGLLGVGAMIPAGRFEVLQGAKLDHASAIGRQAFRDLKVRGYLNPASWRNAGVGVYYPPDMNHTSNWFSTNNSGADPPGITPVVVLDPMGMWAPTTFGAVFPYGMSTAAPNLFLTRIVPNAYLANPTFGGTLADPIFRSLDDLEFAASTQGKDFPPVQKWLPNDTSMQRRLSAGDYSWMATVVTDPTTTALVGKVTVSVAVFYKRNLADPPAAETCTTRVVSFTGSTYNGQSQPSIAGGEVVLYDEANPTALKPVKPGQWIMLAGTNYRGTTPPYQPLNYFRWYRVVAASSVIKIEPGAPAWTGSTLPSGMPSQYQLQTATLAGADWSAFPQAGTSLSTSAPTSPWPYVWIVDNVIAVYEKNLKLEIQ